jgi:hypothetical protein
VNAAYESRVCRILNIEVVVIIDEPLEAARVASAGATLAHGIEDAVAALTR